MRKALLLLSWIFLPLGISQVVFSQDDDKSILIGNLADEEVAANIVSDLSGNTYVGGKQNNKGLIVKQDAAHTTIWSKTLEYNSSAVNRVTITFLDLLGDTLFGCGYTAQNAVIKGALYFKMNAQTGALYWSKVDLVSTSYFFCMRYANGKFFLVGGGRDLPDLSGKVLAVSSQTGNLIWETPLLHYFLPNPSSTTNHTIFLSATEMVNGKLFITGNTNNTVGVERPILIGVSETGNVFLEKYIDVPVPSGGIQLRGTKIHYDMNQDLVLGFDSDSPNFYAEIFLAKLDILGNVIFCKNYNIDNGGIGSLAAMNETATSYVLFGSNGGNYDGSYVLKVDKNGNVEKCIGISKPNTWTGIALGFFGEILGNSMFLNGNHYFTCVEQSVSLSSFQRDINKIIVDEDLNTIEDCSSIFELVIPVMDVPISVEPLVTDYITQPIPVQNDGILQDVTFSPYCENTSLGLVQNSGCQATITANVSGFIDPTFYWSDGTVSSSNSITVNTTDTVFVRVLDTKCCELFDTIVPSLVPSSFAMNLPADTIVCLQNGNSFMITPTISGTNGPVQYLWSNNSAGPSLSVTTSGTYWLELSDSCLTLRDSMVVTVNSLPVIGNTSNIAVCEGNFPATLNPTVSAGATVLWDDGTTTINRSVDGPGTYTFTATNSCGTTNGSITVSQTDLPDISLVSSIDTCILLGGNIVLSPVFTNTSGVLWSNGSTGNQLTVSTSGTYTVTASNSCGSNSASVLVTLNSLPVIGNAANVAVCEGSFPATLNPSVSAGATVLWDNGTMTINRSVNSPGSYTISATNDCGTVNATIVVSQTDLPTVQLEPLIDTCIQNGTAITLVPVFTGTTTVLWSNGSTGNQLPVSASGIYTVYASNNCGVDSASSSVTINYFPELNLPATLDTCFEIGVGFAYTAQGSAGSYQWNSGSNTATEWISQEGIYTCTLTNQCGSVTETMQVRRLTAVDLYFPNDSIKECAKQFAVSNLQIETNYTLEIFGPGEDLIGSYLTESGWYRIHAFNACGEKWDSIYVNLQNEQFFYLPNSFTPNGDSHNDRFEFKGENIVLRDVRIFNRWGEEIFTESGAFTGWDGTYQGEICPDGIYAVHLIYEDCFGIPTEFSGHVNLIR